MDEFERVQELYKEVETAAAKFFAAMAVKAVGDWELDVLAIPFNSVDSDRQYFDENTDIMESAFSTPLAIYQHGIKQGGRELDDKPVIVGRTVPGSLEKRADGWHIRVVLDKALKVAKDIMDAAWKGLVAVSSDSIAHLARLDIGGKLIQYEKNRPGRIAVWPLAGVSLWEMSKGNARPANRFAIALPAMKAIYREAGIDFPEIENDTDGADQKATGTAEQRTRVKRVLAESDRILERTKKY